MTASCSSSELSSHQVAIRSDPGVQKMPASGISSELSAHQMAPAEAIAHSRAHLCPRASSLFTILPRLATPALRLGVFGSLRPSVFYLFLRRYGRRPGQPSSSSLARRACVHVLPFCWYSCFYAVRRYVTGTRFPGVRLLRLFLNFVSAPGSLRRPRGDGNGGRFVRSPCLPSWRGLRLLYAVHQMLSTWSLYSDGPLSSRPQPLGSVGDDTPCEDTREDFGLSI